MATSACCLPLGPGTTHVGRGFAVDVRLEDQSVSRRHAIVHQRPTGSRILDDRSANGTFVNGRRVTEAELRDGDVVVLGRVVLTYRDVVALARRVAPSSVGGGRRGAPVALSARCCWWVRCVVRGHRGSEQWLTARGAGLSSASAGARVLRRRVVGPGRPVSHTGTPGDPGRSFAPDARDPGRVVVTYSPPDAPDRRSGAGLTIHVGYTPHMQGPDDTDLAAERPNDPGTSREPSRGRHDDAASHTEPPPLGAPGPRQRTQQHSAR